jgi:AbrB family looped-hinge helix DNA binding protein
MKIGDRGQVTIPREFREKLGLKPHTEVEFEIAHGRLMIKKKAKPLNFGKWKGFCRKNLKKMGFESTDAFIETIRGR